MKSRNPTEFALNLVILTKIVLQNVSSTTVSKEQLGMKTQSAAHPRRTVTVKFWSNNKTYRQLRLGADILNRRKVIIIEERGQRQNVN